MGLPRAWTRGPAASGGGGATDHGDLTGLADNDHTQYLLKAGGTIAGQLTVGASSVSAGAAPVIFAVQNDADSDLHSVLRAGLTGNYRCYLNWQNFNGAQAWLMGRNASSDFILYDTPNTAHRLICNNAGETYLNSTGTAAVTINGSNDNGSGSGGVSIRDGGSTKAVTHQFNSNQTILTGSVGAVHTLLRNNLTDATAQTIRMGARHYLVAEQPMAVFQAAAAAGSSILSIGGGTGAMNAITLGRLYAAANNTTITGTSMLAWSTAGVRIQSGATAAASSLFHVSAAGEANALRVDDTNGTTGVGRSPSSTSQLSVESTIAQLGLYRDGNSYTTYQVGAAGDLNLRSQGSAPMMEFRIGSTKTLRINDGGVRIENGVTADTAASAVCELVSTTQGFLPPRMTTTQRDAIGTPATGLVVYNTTTDKLNVYTGSAWEAVTSA